MHAYSGMQFAAHRHQRQPTEVPLATNVHLMPATADTPPGSVGKPGVPTFAPALMNAIFAATGKRIRPSPIGKQLET